LVHSDFDPKTDVVFETSLSVEKLEAPFESGLTVGRLYARDKNGKLLAQTELVVTADVEAHGFLLFMAKLKGFVLSPAFLILVTLIAALIWYSVHRDRRRQKRRLRYHRR